MNNIKLKFNNILDLIKEDLNPENKKLNIFKYIYRAKFISKYNFIIHIRLFQSRFSKERKFIREYMRDKILKKYSSHIAVESVIGRKVNFPHPIGIVIGEGSIINNKCTIYQNVTIGKKSKESEGYPIIGENVTIYSGATIIGEIYIGNNSVIAANSVVISNVEKNSLYGGIPAKKIKDI